MPDDKVLVPKQFVEWADDLYAAFCNYAVNAQQDEALKGFALASNYWRSQPRTKARVVQGVAR
jgi:hypothetical protein